MLEQLKNVNVDRSDLDEIVELLGFGNIMLATYANAKLEPPEWLTETVTTLTREAGSRRRDNLERSLKQAKGRLETLKTADQKRADAQAVIERLTAELGL